MKRIEISKGLTRKGMKEYKDEKEYNTSLKKKELKQAQLKERKRQNEHKDNKIRSK